MAETREPYLLTATEALAAMADGAFSAREWLASCQARIAAREPAVRAWAYLNPRVAEEAATWAAGGAGPSLPVGVKDIIDVVGQPTMMGADFHDARPATREGGSIAIMRAAGCAFVGKTVTTELGHRHPGPTRNPHNLAHTPGGSSSGSAAAVADFMVPLCLGTQTSGSIIRPAAYCGVIGYKPTYNDFDKTGMLANAPSMDTLGIMARAIDDVWLLRQILSETPASDLVAADLATVRAAVLMAPPWTGASDELRGAIEGLASGLAAAGAKLTTVDLDDEVDELRALHRLISGFEFRRSVAFEKFQHRDRLSAILRDGRLADGEGADLADYHRAMARAVSLRAKLARVFDDIDILLAPAAPGPALATLDSTGDAAFASAWTLLGHPSLSLPLFRAADGLPLGCQVIGGATKDARLLSICKAVMARFAAT